MSDGEAEIDVADSGNGIRTSDSQRIFERLYRSGSAVAQQVPGAGLGLTIALAIAEAHGGSITLVRRPTPPAPPSGSKLPLARAYTGIASL